MRRALHLGLGLTALSLALHLAPIWVTSLSRGSAAWNGTPLAQDYIAQVIEHHRSGPDMSFRRRPLTTWGLDAMQRAGLTPKAAFMLWGFGLFLVCGLLVHALARAVFAASGAEALAAQAAFHLSPTVLCAWFEPMYTYDEPLQYAAFLAGMLAAGRGRPTLAAIALAVSIAAHETSVLLLPALIALGGSALRQRLATALAAAALAAAFLLWHMRSEGLLHPSGRDAWARLGTIAFNLGSPAMAAETLGYLLMALLLPCFLLARNGRGAGAADRRMLRAFWLAVAANTVAVLVAAKAREARVLALPLLIGWPLLGAAIHGELQRQGGWRALLGALGRPALAGALLLLAAALYALARIAFPLSTNVQGDNLWHELLALQLAAAAALWWLGRRRSAPVAA